MRPCKHLQHSQHQQQHRTRATGGDLRPGGAVQPSPPVPCPHWLFCTLWGYAQPGSCRHVTHGNAPGSGRQGGCSLARTAPRLSPYPPTIAPRAAKPAAGVAQCGPALPAPQPLPPHVLLITVLRQQWGGGGALACPARAAAGKRLGGHGLQADLWQGALL